jgi:flagellar hook-associated protein 2
MPTLRSSGVGSGIDINGLVAQLVAAERAPAEQRLQRAGTRITTQLSALGTLRGALSALQSSVSALKTPAAFQGRRADTTDGTLMSATADSSAATGSYTVEVKQLASAQKLASGPYVAGPDAVVGTGTLTISSGGKSFDVSIAESANSLRGVRDAINAAAGNDVVQATLIQAVDGARLVLTARATGATSAIQVTPTGGDGGLVALAYQAGGTTNLVEIAAARNAEAVIDGFTVQSTSNVLGDAIDGVSIALLAAKPGTDIQLNVGNDESATREKVQKFVADLNTAMGTLAKLRAYDPATSTAGPLLGDSMLRGIEESLRRQVSSASSSAAAPYNSLNSIGITIAADGTFSLDESRLTKALAADYDSVGRLFGSTDGVGVRIADVLDRALRSDGQVTARNDSLLAGKKSLDRDQAALDARMVSVEARYRAQFIAMDSLLASLQNTSNYLAQQLKGLPSSG